jgi:hypothetical protein
VVGYAYNPKTQEAEAGGSRNQGQPGLHSETLSLKERKRMGRREGRKGGRKKRKREREKKVS